MNVHLLLHCQTYNSHPELKNFYKVLSTNSDGTLEFVSTVEGRSAVARLCRPPSLTGFCPPPPPPLGSTRVPHLRDAVAPGEKRL